MQMLIPVQGNRLTEKSALTKNQKMLISKNQERELFFRLLLLGMQNSAIAPNQVTELIYWLLPERGDWGIWGNGKKNPLIAGIAEELAVSCQIKEYKDSIRLSNILYIVESRMDTDMQKEFLFFLRSQPTEVEIN